MGQGIQESTSKICGKQPLKIWSAMVCLGRPFHFKFFKACLPQILLGQFLNTFSHIIRQQNYLVSKMLYASKLVAPPDRYDDDDDDDNELFWGGLLYSGKELLLSTKDWKS